MQKTRVISILLILVLVMQLGLPVLAADDGIPSVKLTVRALTDEEMPANAPKDGPLYGLFVRSGSESYGLKSCSLCLSMDNRILPYDIQAGTVVSAEEVSSGCFQSLGVYNESLGRKYYYIFEKSTAKQRDDGGMVLYCSCVTQRAITVYQEQDLFVMYFQIQDGGLSDLTASSIRLETDPEMQRLVYAEAAANLCDQNGNTYVYAPGSAGTDTPLPAENISLVIDVPEGDVLQSAAITVPSELQVPTEGLAELQLGVTATGLSGPYNDPYTAVWSMVDDGDTGAALDAGTGVLSIGPGGRAGTVIVQAQVSAGGVSVTAQAPVTVTRADPVPTSVTLYRDGTELSGTDTVLSPIGSEPSRTYRFSAQVRDQYGDPMADEPVIWTEASNEDPEHLVYSDGTLTVYPDAQPGSSVKLTATAGSVSRSVTVSAANLQPDWSAVEGLLGQAVLTYGQEPSEVVKLPAAGTASAAGMTLNGTFSFAGGTHPSVDNPSVTVAFTVADAGDYEGVTFRQSFPVTVLPKEIQVQADDKTAYCGAALPDLTATIPGDALENGDTAADLHLSLSTAADPDSQPGDYAITGTSTAVNYHVTVLEGTLTMEADAVASVTCADGSRLPGALTLSAQEVREATSLANLGLPEQIVWTGVHGAKDTTDASWNCTLQALQDLADTAAKDAPARVTITLDGSLCPAWAAVPSQLPSVPVTIVDKHTIPAQDLKFPNLEAVYSEAYTPKATVADRPEYAGMTFTYTWEGGTTLPTGAGTYTLTVTAENDGYRGTATAQLTILPKKLTADMITVDPGPYTYTGSEIRPQCTLSDVSGGRDWLSPEDCNVSYLHNVHASGSADPEVTPYVDVTADPNGNYTGSILIPFSIVPASLADKTPVVAGTPAVGSPLTATLSGVDDGAYTWQWFRDGAAIDGARDAVYVPTSADSGRVLTVQATASGSDYSGATRFSAAVTVEKQAISGTVAISEAVNVSGGTEGVIEPGDTLRADVQLTTPVDVICQWYLDGKAVSGGETFQVPSGSAGCTVTVVVTPADGHYTGSVSSGNVVVGKTALRGAVTLRRDGDTVTAALSGNLSDATCTLVWLRNGQVLPQASGLTYTLTEADLGTSLSAKAVGRGDCTGEIVSAALSIPATAPGAPNVTAQAGDGTVTVSWTAGATGGAPITGYRLTVTGGGQTILDKTLDNLTTSFTVTELVNGTTYTFTVSAINAAGTGQGSSVPATPEASGIGGGGIGGGGTVDTPEEPDTPAVVFDDVPVDRWSASYIYNLTSRGVVNGFGDGRFLPDRPVTRAQFVKLLSGVAGVDPSAYAGVSTFADVDRNAWYAPYVAWAVDSGVTNGTSAATFSPDDTITREEMAAMLYRFTAWAGLTLPDTEAPADFTDAGTFSPWAVEAISALQRSGILSGTGSGRFTPDGLATREQACKVLSLLLDLTEA